MSNSKVSLTDFSFLVIVRIDSLNRLENLLLAIDFLHKHFDTNITVWECTSFNNGFLKRLLKKKVYYRFIEDHDLILHRTRYLNQMIEESCTSFLAIWDADVIAPIEQIIESAELLRNHKADFVYPYARYFLDTSDVIRRLYLEKLQIQVLMRNRNKMKEMYLPNPVGGAFFANRKKYIEAGMENEKFYGWGIEDGERCVRWDKLNYKIKQVEGVLFHLNHPRGLNSFPQHPDQQLIKIREHIFSSHLQHLSPIGKNIQM
jgi:predicted glycosyltransferase involved in capsule biosynthesis